MFKSPNRRLYGFLLFSGLFGLAMLYVFAPVLSHEWVMLAPDFPKYYPAWAGTQQLEAFLTGKDGVVPFSLFSVLPPLLRQELFFMLTSFGAALSVFYYLRTQKLARLAAYGGGLFFALSGYSFTLFCAGHGGYFMLIYCGFFAFGLINRCFQSRHLVYFALLGATLIWSEIHQPDIWLLFVFLILTYGVWRSIREWREQKRWDFLWRVYPRFILTVAIILLIGSRQIKVALTDTLAGREKQFAEAATNVSDTADSVAQRKLDRWIFATNWSLPPEDLLEFIVPGVFGDASFQLPHPYWGRLGQPYAFQKGKMMPNYRQHTVYLGAVAFFLAWLALFAWLSTRKKSGALASEQVTADYADVPFWIGVWGVCLVIALGRYTPVYKLIYSYLPYMDYLRAPVKFHHLLEIANAFLAAYGLEYLLRRDDAARSACRRGAVGGVVLATALLTGGIMVHLKATAIEGYITELGMGTLAQTLLQYSAYNLLRATLIVGFVTALAYWLSRGRLSTRLMPIVVGCIIMLNTADLALVARRFVFPVNVGPHHAVNPVIKAMQLRTGGKPANVMNYVTSNAGEQDWFSMALELNGFANMMPKPNEQGSPQAMLFNAWRQEPLRYWQSTGVRFVLLPRSNVDGLVRQGLVAVVCDFEIGSGVVRKIAPSAKSLVLAEVIGLPGLPAVYYEWQGPVPPEQQVAQILKLSKPLDCVANVAALIKPISLMSPQRVDFEVMRKMPGVLATRGKIKTASAGLLVFNELFDVNSEAFVDGVKTTVFQANGLWAAILVPAGEHAIVLRPKRDYVLNAVSVVTSLMILGWGLMRLRSRALPNN